MPTDSVLSRLATEEAKDSETSASSPEAAQDQTRWRLGCERPIEPENIQDLGVSEQFLEDNLLKLLNQWGAQDPHTLAWRMKISKKIVEQLCVSLSRRKLIGAYTPDPTRYEIGAEGKKHVEEANTVTRYMGPVPVTERDYIEMMEQQLRDPDPFDQKDVQRAYSRLVMYDKRFLEVIGPAVRSQRSILLYGKPGNGKTTLGKCLTALMKKDILIPYAIFSNGQVIKVFDPSQHKPIEDDSFEAFDISKVEAVKYDRRWVMVRTPYIEVSTEFKLRDFELSFNAYSRVYEMPLHIKAVGGVFFIDDFGRQEGDAEWYLNRLITPLQSRADNLRLVETGGQIRVPFFTVPIFSTNLWIEDLGDEAFIRRFKYKIFCRSPKDQDFYDLFKFECQRQGVPFDEGQYQKIMQRFKDEKIPLRGCQPNDLLTKIKDHCNFWGIRPELTDELIDIAWELNFSKEQEE